MCTTLALTGNVRFVLKRSSLWYLDAFIPCALGGNGRCRPRTAGAPGGTSSGSISIASIRPLRPCRLGTMQRLRNHGILIQSWSLSYSNRGYQINRSETPSKHYPQPRGTRPGLQTQAQGVRKRLNDAVGLRPTGLNQQSLRPGFCLLRLLPLSTNKTFSPGFVLSFTPFL